VHAAPFLDVDFGGRRFDLIVSWHVVEHLRDPFGALRRMHELLLPHGLLHLAVPDMAEPHKTPLGLFHFAHLHGFTHETLEMMAAKAGFSVADDTQKGTILLLRRLPAPDPNWFKYPTHARDLEGLFRGRTLWRFLAGPRTYARFFRRIRYLWGDYWRLWRSS
jgi:hypothetical protein